MKNTNLLVSAIVLVFASPAIALETNAAPVIDKHCLTSFDKKIMLEWSSVSVGDEDWDGSFIKYGLKKKPISIYLQSMKVIDDEPVGRPKEFSRKYLEIVDGKISGEYIFNTQGVNFIDGYYKNYKSKKVTSLSGEDIFGFECAWK